MIYGEIQLMVVPTPKTTARPHMWNL